MINPISNIDSVSTINPISTINPTTEEIIKDYNFIDNLELEAILNQSFIAYQSWKRTDFLIRTELMNRVAGLLRDRKFQFAELMALEMGKPLDQGVAEVEKCTWVCVYYAENAEKFLADESVPTEMQKSYICFRPIGPVLAVMPWNFPFWQVFRFAAPNIMAGNTALVKHSPNTMGCALAIEELFRDAGYPDGVFKNLIIDIPMIRDVIADSRVAGVTVTGSTRAGKSVAEIAGANLKKSILELGGSDPYIILEDADLSKAANSCANSRMINCGQSCIAAKRFIVVNKVAEEFTQLFAKAMTNRIMGDPSSPGTNLGPMARQDLRDDLHRQVVQSVAMGAKIIAGGYIPDRQGWFYPPTVVANVSIGMPLYEEEVFGPVGSIIIANDRDHALSIANDSNFGLGAAIFSRNKEFAEVYARDFIDSGSCFVNDFVKSDPRLPFGGTKSSGYGRELSPFGIREFTNVKTICVI